MRDNLGPMQDSAAHAWMLPDEPAPVRLMNTMWANADGVHDELQTVGDLGSWLEATGSAVAAGRVTARDLATARQARDALRELAAHVTAEARDNFPAPASLDRAVQRVNGLAAMAPPPVLQLAAGRLERSTAPGSSPVTAALAHVALDAIDLLGDAGQLRGCQAPGCILYFVRTHPRREWCSVACGNRVRAARHYQKARARLP
jgi:predicted RNA-binding Zn ribbon-like protein